MSDGYDVETTDTKTPSTSAARAEIALKRLRLAKQAVDKQRTREKAALEFQVPELQWTEDMRQGRQGEVVAGVQLPDRPMITVPSLNQPIQLLQNQMRTAQMGITITPLNEEADDDTAEVLRDLYRREAQRGGADTARFWAYDRAMKAGTGAYALDTEWDEESENPFDQRIIWRRIWDAGNVFFDPVVQEANPRKMEYAFEINWVRHSKIRRDYKESRLAGYGDDELTSMAADEPDWVSFGEANDEPMCCVATYWHKEYEEKTWVILDDGSFAYAEDIPEGRRLHPDSTVNTHRRTVQVPRVVRSLLYRDEELEEPKEWNGKHIPLIPTIGVELQPFDGERRCHGIIEPSMGSVKLKNWSASTIVEGASSETKSPWIIYEGQDEGYETMWQQSAVRNFPALKIKPVVGPNGQLLPPPIKNQGDLSRIAPGLQLLQISDQFLQAATTTIDQSQIEQMGRRRVAHQTIQSVQEQSDFGNSHYMLNMKMVSLPYEAEVFMDLAPRIYDRPGRVARLFDMEDNPRTVMLNQKFHVDPRTKRPVAVDADGDGQADGVKHFDLRKGRYGVQANVTKDYESRAAQGANEILQVIGQDPALFTLLGPVYMKFRKDMPGHQEAAELLKRHRARMMPGIDQDPNDPQAQQDPQALAAENQALKAQMQQMQALLEKEGLKVQAQKAIAASKDATTLEKTRMDNETKLAVAELGAKVDRMALFLDERARLGTQQHDSALAAADAGHDEHMARMGHAHAIEQGQQQAAQAFAGAGQQHADALEQGDASHQQALEQGAQGHQFAQEQAQQAADLAPEPEAGV
jgi:hypothetical protein